LRRCAGGFGATAIVIPVLATLATTIFLGWLFSGQRVMA